MSLRSKPPVAKVEVAETSTVLVLQSRADYAEGTRRGSFINPDRLQTGRLVRGSDGWHPLRLASIHRSRAEASRL